MSNQSIPKSSMAPVLPSQLIPFKQTSKNNLDTMHYEEYLGCTFIFGLYSIFFRSEVCNNQTDRIKMEL